MSDHDPFAPNNTPVSQRSSAEATETAKVENGAPGVVQSGDGVGGVTLADGTVDVNSQEADVSGGEGLDAIARGADADGTEDDAKDEVARGESDDESDAKPARKTAAKKTTAAKRS